MTPARTILLLIAGVLLASCEKEQPKPQQPAQPSAKQGDAPSPPAKAADASLDAFRSAFAAAGVSLPQSLRIALTRKTCQVYCFDVDSKASIDTWKLLRAVTDKTGWYPLVVHDLHIEEVDERPEETDPADTLQEAGSIDAATWLKQRLDGRQPQSGAGEGKPEPNTSFTVPIDDLTGEPAPDVRILLVPTRNGWEVPAFVPFGGAGGWNDCPQDAAHVAVLKYWFERFGAELVAMSDDVLELQIARPPASDEAAAAIANEQYAYCGDIVEQGVGTVPALAQSIKACGIWYFWWD